MSHEARRDSGPIRSAKTRHHALWLALLASSLSAACGSTAPIETATSVASDVLPPSLVDWPGSVGRPRFSPDGRSIAFSSDREGATDLYVVEVETDTVSRVAPSAATDHRPAWSPDGKELVFQSDRQGGPHLFVVTLADGSVRQITHGDWIEAAPDWSPNGDLITYVSQANGNWDLWAVRPDGSGARPITTHEGNEYHPKFSPDGSQIVFYSSWSGWTDLHIVDVDDGGIRDVLLSEHEDYRPQWSADGDSLVFATDRGQGGIWTISSQGGEPEPLIESERELDYPDPSSDGSALLYLEETHFEHLYALDLDSGNVRRITSDDQTAVDRHLDVHPLGDTVVYQTTRFGNEGNVAVHDLPTDDARRLTTGRINDGHPRFSPSGEQLAFFKSGGDRASSDVWVTARGGNREPRQLTHRGHAAFPTFCGEDLVAYLWVEVSYTPIYEIWLTATGHPSRRLGDFSVERTGLDCSRDGSWLVASLYQGGGNEGSTSPRLVRIELDSGRSSVLTQGRVPHLHPRISADGSQILFVKTRGDQPGVFAGPVAGGEARPIPGAQGQIGTADWGRPGTILFSRKTEVDRAKVTSIDL